MSENGISKRTKWSYCVGATGRDAAYALVSMYLMNYVQYTMKLTVAQYAVISGAIVICMIWDAINDPLMGIIIENSHLKRGKFRPWIIMGAILNAVVIVLLFSVRPQGWGFVVFFSLAYLSWGMTYTMNDISYWGMLPSLSSDPKVRDTLVTLMSIFICIGQFLVAGIVPVIIAGNAINAYRIVALVVAIGFIFFQTITYLGVTENKRSDAAEAVTLKKMFKIFSRNDQLIYAGISSLLFNMGTNLLILFGVNFFYFEFGYAKGGNLIFLFTVMYGLGTLFSQALYAAIAKRFKRKTILDFTICALVVGYLMLLSFGYILPKNVILLNVIGFEIFFFQGLYNLAIIVMLNNTIEYDEYKFGERHDSVISAIRSFSVKLAGALNQGVVALTLIISGIYAISQKVSGLENEVGKGEITKAQALSSANDFISKVEPDQTLILRIGMVAVPLAVLITAYIILKKKYHIDEDEYNMIVEKLSEKNKA
jgi:melibiose permease/lactose/raffinose/galactose permease